MTKPGRNDPCPCGSGKKYKKCCIAQEQKEQSQGLSYDHAVPKALGWLRGQHAEALDEAIIETYLGDFMPDDPEEIDPGLAQMIDINAHEWALAEGVAYVDPDQNPMRFLDLVLGLGGPLLLAEERQYLEALGQTPLRLYRIVEVERGEGLWLRDALDSVAETEGEKLWVREKSGSQSLDRSVLLGARVIAGDPNVLSGAIYTYRADMLLDLRREIEAEGTSAVSDVLIAHWLEQVVAPPPTILDAATGEPVLFTTFHYRVRSWQELEQALGLQPDVEGDRKQGWVRLENTGTGRLRSIVSLNPGKAKDRIELFAGARNCARQGRSGSRDSRGTR